jgi:electron-transferring-flavoprotein dehydrogenase
MVLHTAGWPMKSDTYGGALPLPPGRQSGHAGLHHRPGLQQPLSVSVRGDAALEDPSQYPLLPGRRRSQWHRSGKRIAYGARAITAGGLQPAQLVFPGGALVGCEAGFLNVSRIKGSHAAIKTGMLAAEAAYAAWAAASTTSCRLPEAFENSWLHTELNKAATSRPGSRRA